MDFFSIANWPLWALVGLLGGLPLGAAYNRRVQKRAADARRRIPRRWPLALRVIANSEERKVWHWLLTTFFDHAIMIKIPVTRFLLSTSPDHRMNCYELLSCVYCTFTVVSLSGQVVGCIDLAAGSRRNTTSQRVKRTLFDQCNIPYLALDPADLPSLEAVRSRFLGTLDLGKADRSAHEAAIRRASEELRSSLARKRKTRSDFASLSPDGADDSSSGCGQGSREGSQFVGSRWNENSFLLPLDSRTATLRAGSLD